MQRSGGKRGRGIIQVVTLSFFRFDRFAARAWAFAQMGLARRSLARTPGIGFHKLLGSGTGEGFTPIPNTSVYAILATWPGLDEARGQIAEAATYERYRARASEDWTVFLATSSVRGAWSGVHPFEEESSPSDTRIAALTRATIKPSVALRFWGQVPAISDVIGADPNVLFKIGVGEVPWLHQVTFSIWPDATSMAAFARREGPHARAIRAVREGNWFSEELYARFSILAERGTWGGQSPLATVRHA